MIRKILILWGILLNIPGAGWAAQAPLEPRVLFIRAVEAYKDARYDEAVSLNEKIMAQGLESPAVYYNLANSYFRSGKLGKSIANYLRAESLDPRDRDVHANLSFARSLIEYYKPVRKTGLAAWIVAQKFSLDELCLLCAFFLMLWAAMMMWGAYVPSLKRKIVLGSLLPVIMGVYFCAALVMKISDSSGLAVCLSRVEAKFEPSDKATTYFKVPEGAELKVLRAKDGWLKIRRTDGKTGWVPSGTVELDIIR
jgi:tetratricopeptide (TPR) repeat protein